nr:MAG TPA: hypothetical protein [Caudoviricetes sp.]
MGYNDDALAVVDRVTDANLGLATTIAKQAISSKQYRTYSVTLSEKHVILQSFYLVYLRPNATSVAGHQPSYQSRHITFWCCKYNAVLFSVAETNTIHYQYHCHLVLHALRLPLLYFCIVHIL